MMLTFLAIALGLRTIMATSLVDSIISLIGVFITTGLLTFQLNLELFGLLFMIIYSGALAILLLFLIMTLNLSSQKLTPASYWSHIGFTSAISTLLIIMVFAPIYNFIDNKQDLLDVANSFTAKWLSSYSDVSTLSALGKILYIQEPVIVVMAGYLLLIGMLGAIILTLDATPRASKHIGSYKQLQQNPKEAVYLLK